MLVKRLKLIIGIVVVVIILLMLFSGPQEPTPPEQPTSPQAWKWYSVAQQDVPEVVMPGWSKPVLVEASTLGWIESVAISSDGNELYYMFYNGEDLFGKVMRGEVIPGKDQTDIYVSKREDDGQFRKHQPVKKFFMAEPLYSESSSMVDEDGNYFYTTNRECRDGGVVEGDCEHEVIMRNGEVMAFNLKKNDDNPGNPYYCKAKDELWMDYPKADGPTMGVLKSAKANNWDGQVEVNPASPINGGGSGAQNMQPWLSPDCDIMYFTSTRQEGKPGIYMSKRNSDGSWGEATLVIKSKIGVGEPVLPKDMQRLYLSQYIMNSQGKMQTAVYYIEKT